MSPTDPTPALAISLAALIIRQAHRAFAADGMVSGVALAKPGIGLDAEDRQAMALVSRHRLRAGESDVGAEIHELLACCTQPLDEWLPKEAVPPDLIGIRLIDPAGRQPTREAIHLAEPFAGVVDLIEKQTFAALREALDRYKHDRACEYYRVAREFVGRHPLAREEDLDALAAVLPSQVLARVHEWYAPWPPGTGREVPTCAHCHGVMSELDGSLVCTTDACAPVHPATPGPRFPAAELLALRWPIRRYWYEPAVDEFRLRDGLVEAGVTVRMYPDRDRVDLDFGPDSTVGIDVKAYRSPEVLGSRIRRNPGGLLDYAEPWLVVPDWVARRTADYLPRLTRRLEGLRIRVATVSDALREFGHG